MVRRKKRHHFSRRLSAAWQDHALVSNYNQETQTTAQVRVVYLIEEGMWAGSLGRSQLRGAWDTEGSVLSSRLLAKNLRTRYVRPVDEVNLLVSRTWAGTVQASFLPVSTHGGQRSAAQPHFHQGLPPVTF